MKDIETRTDVAQLVDAFYARIRSDDLLGPIFNGHIEEHQWPSHLEKLTDFWESNLFGTGIFRGNPSGKHLNVDRASGYKIDQKHFGRWLMHWFQTVDSLYHGDKADRTKAFARKIAHGQYLLMWNYRSSEPK